MAPITNPSLGLGTYFHRNYREGQRIELHDLADWGWDVQGWGVSPSRKHKKTGEPKKWNSDEKIEFEQKFAITTIRTQGRHKGQDPRLPSEWIDWKNHRLKKVGFYLTSTPPKRQYKTKEAPPRYVLRDTLHKTSPLKLIQDFPTQGHLEFKIWLQNKIEDVAHGRASPRFLLGQGRTREEDESTEKWEELTKKIEDVLHEELLELTGSNNKLSDEVQHIRLMHKIIGRKVGAINIHDPYWQKNLTTFQILQQQKVPSDLLEKICRQIVKLLIGKSKTTLPTRRKVYRYMASVDPSRLERLGAMAGQFEVTPDEVKEEIEDDPLFWKAGKFNSQKFREVLWVRNEKNPLHSETATKLEGILGRMGLNKGGNKKEKLSRLFKLTHEDKTKINLTIDKLDNLDIDPPLNWQFVEVHLPAITFFESLNKVAEDEVWGSLEEVKKIARLPNDEFELRHKDKNDPNLSRGLTVTEHKQLENLLLPLKWDPHTKAYNKVKQKGCFGIWNWPQDDQNPKTKTPKEATHHNVRKLIYNIIMILMEEDYIKFEGMTHEEYEQHFPSSNNSKGHLSRGKKAKVHAIHFTEKLRGLIGKSEYKDFIDKEEHPIYRVLRGASDRWMYSPPQRHKMGKPPQAGGLLIEKDRSITNSSNRDYEEMKPKSTPRCEANREVLDAMNTLQDTQWEINLHLLQALFDVRLEGSEIVGGGLLSNHPVRDWHREKRQLIEKISPKRTFSNVFWGADDDEEIAVKKEMLVWVKKIIEHNANVFWHSWEIDFRGRLYPKCTRLSPHGNDLNKAIIRFKHWKPLGDAPGDRTGIDWIHVHVHNMMEGVDEANGSSIWASGRAEKKQTFETRIKWVEENLKLLREMANNLGNGKYKHILRLDKKQPGKDDVYQRTAALLELDRAHTEYEKKGQDWSKVYSGHPIYLDATCNGYQHASTLLGNRKLAELVNVVGKPGANPKDLYDTVAKAAKKMSVGTQHLTADQLRALAKAQGLRNYSKLKRADLVDALCRHIPLMESAKAVRDYLAKFLTSDPIENNQLDIAINLIFNRSVAKKPTMTSAYGSDDLRQSFEGKGKEGKPLYWSVKKTQKEIDADEAKLNNLEKEKKIDKKYRDYYLRLKKTTTPYSERGILRKELQKMKDTNKLSSSKYKEYRGWILPTKTQCIWNDGSSLAVAILGESKLHGKRSNPKEEGFLIDGQSGLRAKKTPQKKLGSYLGQEDALDPVVRQDMDERARRQHELTALVTKAYKDAIKFVTKGAFEAIQDALKKVAEDGNPNPAPKTTKSKGDGLWPGVVWYLPQNDKKGFRINHYRINKPDPSKTRGKNPCRPRSVFNARLPDWYTVKKYNGNTKDKQKARILQRLEELYGTNPKVINALNAKGKPRGKIDEILKIVDPKKQDKDAGEVRRILRYCNISRYTYDKDEWRRIDHHKGEVAVAITKLKKAKKEKKLTDDELKDIITSNHRLPSSLLPNFIHSIDAYHMRETIRRCDIRIDDLSFWAVHDAFGTHACDVDTMIGIVKHTFHDIHEGLDFKGWIGARSMDLKLKHILASEYIVN